MKYVFIPRQDPKPSLIWLCDERKDLLGEFKGSSNMSLIDRKHASTAPSRPWSISSKILSIDSIRHCGPDMVRFSILQQEPLSKIFFLNSAADRPSSGLRSCRVDRPYLRNTQWRAQALWYSNSTAKYLSQPRNGGRTVALYTTCPGLPRSTHPKVVIVTNKMRRKQQIGYEISEYSHQDSSSEFQLRYSRVLHGGTAHLRKSLLPCLKTKFVLTTWSS